jgi:tripartite ATP-independent transporter DctP family solute receptor
MTIMNKKMNSIARIRSLALSGVAALFVVTGYSAAEAQTQMRIGWTTGESEIDPYAITARELQRALEEVAPGEFTLSFFPSRQLGDEREMLENISLGVQDAGIITGTAIATMESAFQLNDMPFLYSSSPEAHAMLDGPVGQQLMETLTAHDIVGLGFAEAGFRHTINNVRPIGTPEDFSGIRLRVQPSDLFIDAFQAAGASPTAMAWGEVFTAVQQGAVDGLEIPLNVILGNNYDEVTTYLSLTGHSYNAVGLLVSQRFMDGLSEDNQAALREAAAIALDRQREANAQNEEAALDALMERGMQVNEVTDHGAFRERMGPVYDAYRDAVGGDILDAALSQLGED